MRVAVIGARNVGKALGEALAAKGRRPMVYAMSNDPMQKPAETVEKAVAGADAIIFATPYDATGSLPNIQTLEEKFIRPGRNEISPPHLTRCPIETHE